MRADTTKLLTGPGAVALDRLRTPEVQRIAWAAAAGGILAYGAIRLLGYLAQWDDVVRVTTTMDHRLYSEAGRRWLEGGPMYPAWQLARPFGMEQMPELYPPAAVVLFAVMSLLPAILWWAIPLTIIGAIVWHHRPTRWGWVAVAALFIVWPHTWTAIQLGNPILWVAAAMAIGTIYRPAAVLVLLKPTLAPFALLGARSRGWWIGLVVLAAVTLILPWRDYLTVLTNVRNPDPLYSLHDAGIVLIPVVASAMRRRRT